MVSSPDPDPEVLLVCHAGAQLGMGHLTRMLVLADALDDADLDPRLLIQGDVVARSELARFGHSWVGHDGDLVAAVQEAVGESPPRVVVLDLHPRLVPAGSGTLLESLSEKGIRLVAVDGMFDLCATLDAVWVPSFMIDGDLPEPCAAKAHHGWDSYLIRRRLPVRDWVPGRKVLVLTGGSDVTGQAATLPALLEAGLPAETEVHWVRGPFASPPAAPDEARLEWTVHEAPDGIDELLTEADYALTVFGVTLFEILQYGLPAVVFSPYPEGERPELGPLAESGAAAVAEDAPAAVAELAALMGDDARAEKLAGTARELLAVSGADRLAALIHSLV